MGSVGGAIDLPVAREATTDYPVIAGSSLKGAIRDKAQQDEQDDLNWDKVFGTPDSAGDILVSDARLLLLPVRCLSGSYKWTTCPHLIERLQRDLRRAKYASEVPVLPEEPARGQYLGSGSSLDPLYLEERTFRSWKGLPTNFHGVLEKLVAHESTRKRIAGQLIVLNDDDFSWFARYGLPVQARNKLDENKTSENLWYEETLPPDSLFYAMIAGRTPEVVQQIAALMKFSPYMQTGGNETVGQGWFAVRILLA
jgi:CRISPR-associated protein Cmr4